MLQRTGSRGSLAGTALFAVTALGLVGVVYAVLAEGVGALLGSTVGTAVGVAAATGVVLTAGVLGQGNPRTTSRIVTYLSSIVVVTLTFLAVVWLLVFLLVGFAVGGVLGLLTASGVTLVLGGVATLGLLGALWDGDASTSWALNLRMVAAISVLALCTVVAFVIVWFFVFIVLSFVMPALLAVYAAGTATFCLLVGLLYQERKQAMDIESRADATPVTREEYPALYERVTRIAQQLSIPVPTVALSERDAPEAIVVGFRPSETHLVLSRGTLDAVEGEELDAVIAHELAHVANRDAMVMTLVSTPVVFLDGIRAKLLGGVSTSSGSSSEGDLSEAELWGENEQWRLTEPGPLDPDRVVPDRVGLPKWLLAVLGLWTGALLVGESDSFDGVLIRLLVTVAAVGLLVTWLVSRVIVALLSRAREAAADRTAAEVTGSPTALAGALRSLDDRIAKTPAQDLRAVSSVSSLSILPLDRGLLDDTDSGVPDPPQFVVRLNQRLFGTHPPVETRLETLARLESQQESE